MKYTKEYPINWFTYLKVGDIVKCVKLSWSGCGRTKEDIGVEFPIGKDSQGREIIYYQKKK